jgi:hypothetical protein
MVLGKRDIFGLFLPHFRAAGNRGKNQKAFRILHSAQWSFWDSISDHYIYSIVYLIYIDPHVSNLDRTRCLAGCEESFVP